MYKNLTMTVVKYWNWLPTVAVETIPGNSQNSPVQTPDCSGESFEHLQPPAWMTPKVTPQLFQAELIWFKNWQLSQRTILAHKDIKQLQSKQWAILLCWTLLKTCCIFSIIFQGVAHARHCQSEIRPQGLFPLRITFQLSFYDVLIDSDTFKYSTAF